MGMHRRLIEGRHLVKHGYGYRNKYPSLASLAEEGPFFASLRPDVYHGFLAHCPVRGMRFNAHQAYNMRASKMVDEHLDNSVSVENIRKHR